MAVMKSSNADLAFVINIHERLSRRFPLTNYVKWARHVHALSVSVDQKWELLLAWKVDPSEYSNPTLFSADWQLWKLLSKFSVGETPDENSKDVAYGKFTEAENRCRNVNLAARIRDLPEGYHRIMHGVQKICARTLGTIEDFSKFVEGYQFSTAISYVHACNRTYLHEEDRLDATCPQFGPGVSVSASGSPLSTVGEKLVLGTVTSDCAYLSNWLSGIWKLPHARIVRGDVLTYVLKSVGEARTICYGPSMNMLFQKLIGDFIRMRLKVVYGVDLNDQSRNRNLAQLGSLCDSYATMDLTSASDLNACSFVMDALPFEWFSLLDACRSKYYFDDRVGEWVPYEKFSTMGNGFTFELETLLFLATVKSSISTFHDEILSRDEVSVYGDDLIFPRRFYNTVEQGLMIFGHLPNRKKSFASGSFRESCGGDFFNGWNVTPFKIKRCSLNDDQVQTVINIYNGLYAVSRPTSNRGCICSWFDDALLFIKRWLLKYHPRISEGPEEYVYSNKFILPQPQPSNRWLWAEDPRLNVVWNKALHCRSPKTVRVQRCQKQNSFSHQQPMLSELVFPYVAQFGLTFKEDKVDRFVRNPDLQLGFRPLSQRRK